MTDLTLPAPPKGAPLPKAGQAEKANGTIMVTIGCKLPNGLLLEMGRIGDPDYVVVALKGANDSAVVGGYGMTQVSEDFWKAWYQKNQGLTFVKKQMVFVAPDVASAASKAMELAEKKSGFEALDPLVARGGKDSEGRPLLEVDRNHFDQARRDVAQVTKRMANPGA